MWKYVSRRVKDTIELGINVRKSFTIQQFSLNQNQQQQDPKQHDVKPRQKQLLLLNQDPSRDKDEQHEKFKRKYYRLNNNTRCFLNALTWSTAIITGFYTSQLLCLYKRNLRLRDGGSQCYYSKYLFNTTKSIHKNVKYLLRADAQHAIVPYLPKFECPFKEKRTSVQRKGRKTIEDDFLDFKHFIDPGYRRFERYFESDDETDSKDNVYNTGNETLNKPSKRFQNDSFVEPKRAPFESQEDRENASIDGAIQKLSHMVGELEYQMGIESFTSGDFKEAVNHFRLSSVHNHPGGIFNLALCYEQGIGTAPNLKTARGLYEIASSLGHAKAFYNLGVYAAQGLGGFRKSFGQAKKFFEQAADLGSQDADRALQSLHPPSERLPIVIEDFQVDEIFSTKKPISTNSVVMNQNNLQNLRQVAVF